MGDFAVREGDWGNGAGGHNAGWLVYADSNGGRFFQAYAGNQPSPGTLFWVAAQGNFLLNMDAIAPDGAPAESLQQGQSSGDGSKSLLGGRIWPPAPTQWD